MHWLLNPDAELELTRPHGYSPKRQVVSAMHERAEKFRWLTLADPTSFLDALPPQAAGEALLWCPTPRALSAARKAGFSVPRAPEVEVLALANHKENVCRMGLPSPKVRAFVRTRTELEALLSRVDGREILRTKRALSFAGRAQRRLRGELTGDDWRFVTDSLNMGGLLVESEQIVAREWSLHGVVWGGSARFGGAAQFEVTLGKPCSLNADEHGSISSIQRAEPRGLELEVLAERAARELFELGYFGPFGLDFLESDHGLVASDLNARFTLGWSIGMGDERFAALLRMFALGGGKSR
jgi:hypothetical protein